jgi:hypothetical protein
VRKKILMSCVNMLFLLAPLLCAQNPDELLVVRLPATQGYLNRHATPLQLPAGRSQAATPSRHVAVYLHPKGEVRGDNATDRGQAVGARPAHKDVAPFGRGKKSRNLVLR